MFNRSLFQAAIQNKLAQDGLTLRDVAKEIDVSISTLSRVSRGYDPDIDTFASLVKWMGVDANTFLEYSPCNKDVLWVKLSEVMYELDVPSELVDAIMTIVRVIKKSK